jgi:hypothetical protein
LPRRLNPNRTIKMTAKIIQPRLLRGLGCGATITGGGASGGGTSPKFVSIMAKLLQKQHTGKAGS